MLTLSTESFASDRWSPKENQLHAETDQDNCNSSDDNVMCAHNGSFPLQTALNAGATGLRDTNHDELSNVILCLPTAATADY